MTGAAKARSMPRKAMPPHVHRKRARGHIYYYFDTGAKNDAGRPVLRRMPDMADRQFGPAYAQALAARGRRKAMPDQMTVARMIELWQSSDAFRKLAPSTRTVYADYAEEVMKLFGKAPVNELARSDVIRMMDQYAGTPGKANMMLAVIGSLYKWGRKREYTVAKPTEDVERHESTDYEPWPETVIEAALASDQEAVRVGVALLYFTAQRVGDVCAMQWGHITDGRIQVTQQKTGKALSLPIHSRLSALLPSKRGMTILTNANGDPFTPDTFRQMLKKWTAKFDLRLVPHGLRKNAVNALLEAGCSVAETSAMSGQTLQLVEHYAKRRNQSHLSTAAILKWENAR